MGSWAPRVQRLRRAPARRPGEHRGAHPQRCAIEIMASCRITLRWVSRSGCGSGGLQVEPAEGVQEQALVVLIGEDGEGEPWPELEFGGGQVDARYLVEPLPEFLAELRVVERRPYRHV